jgi:Lon protease-like protein
VRRQIPLFPLSTVLFPGLIMPLHIFEPRYSTLVQDLLALPDEAVQEFGVVAIREGLEVGADGVRALHPVGCTALLREVDDLGEGRYDVVTVGAERFSILELDDSAPYLRAEVEILEERPGAEPDEIAVLLGAVTRDFARYRAALQGAPAELDDLATSGLDADEDFPDGVSADADVLSYAVAAAAILDVHDKQRLLAAPDLAARLRLEHKLLRREHRVIRALPSLPAVEVAYLPIGRN